jgi:hypothetical protein
MLGQTNSDKVTELLKIVSRPINDEALQRQHQNIFAAKDLCVQSDTVVKIDILEKIASNVRQHAPIPARERRNGHPVQEG